MLIQQFPQDDLSISVLLKAKVAALPEPTSLRWLRKDIIDGTAENHDAAVPGGVYLKHAATQYAAMLNRTPG